eukprot:TRINITY_DN1720_c0_g1_i1.p1 TRINITY_DN1720_c0_g1~~TRINITY_DN1720_c0_g1_i1.p1  ORF type:complete len:480 (+),score=163.78 TRINITY_DN1720_c0_g1_i1:99-1538(+)
MNPGDSFDAIIIGAGIAGSALAHALGTQGRNVLLIERSLKEPDRIVGELLQPGGVLRLKELGIENCLEGIDAADVFGYSVILNEEDRKDTILLPYPRWKEEKVIGRSFHHGRFVMKLRNAAKSAPNVKVVEGTARNLIEEEETESSEDKLVKGVEYKSTDGSIHRVYAPLTFVCDGCFSDFRKRITSDKPPTVSNFVGLVLKDVSLPSLNYGHVFLANPGPILCYQIGSNEIRVLVDVPNPMPQPIKDYLVDHTAPQLADPSIRQAFLNAVNDGKVRSMPNSLLHPTQKAIQPGVVFVGDSWNMRHPLTGGGMTVALSDVVCIRDTLSQFPNFEDSQTITQELSSNYLPKRKNFASTINILSFALHSVFCASDDPVLPLMRKACLDYFKLGGNAVNGPLGLLSGMNQSPAVLLWHFFSVAIYGAIRNMLPIPWPSKIISSWKLIAAASWIVIPLMKGEKVFGPLPTLLSFIFAAQKRKS